MAIHHARPAAITASRSTFLDRMAAALRRMQLAVRRSLRHLRQAPVAARAAQRRAGGARAAGMR